MTTPLPAQNILNGSASPTIAQMQTALGNLYSYLAGLLNTTGAAIDARTALGAAASGANNDITSLSALTAVPTVVSNSVVNLTGNQNVAGVKTFSSPPTFASTPNVTAAQSMVRLNTFNMYGSTNTMICRFTYVNTNQGADITYTDSATLGASFTVNTAGVYSISFALSLGAASLFGLSLNTASPATAFSAISTSERLAGAQVATNQLQCVTWTGYLPSGSVIRAHGDGTGANASPQLVTFTMTRVS